MRTLALLVMGLVLAAAVMAPGSRAFGQAAATPTGPAVPPQNESLERILRALSPDSDLVTHPQGVVQAPSDRVPATVSHDNVFLLTFFVSGGPGLSLATFSEMVKAAPKELISEDVRKQLLSGGNLVKVESFGEPKANELPQGFTYQLTLVAPSAERVKDLARGLMVACEYAWAHNGRDTLLREVAQEKQRLAELTEKAKAATLQYEEAMNLLRQQDVGLAGRVKPGEIVNNIVPKEVVDGLRAKLYLVGADIAASNARIDAASKKRQEPKVPLPQMEFLGNLILQAEIDLAGQLSQQKTLADLVNAMELVNVYNAHHPLYLKREVDSLALSVATLQKAVESGGVVLSPRATSFWTARITWVE
jgi:hypothetical protein